jgi:hypothetical protein
MRRKLRQALWNDRSLDNQSKDLREIFEGFRDVEHRKVTGLYHAALVLKVDEKPDAIELIRCINPATPDTPVVHGSVVGFKMTAAGAQVTRIEDMTPSATKYEFLFRITYGDS